MEKHTDPITTSVVQHRLHGIVEEMGEAMLRTSYSQILNSDDAPNRNLGLSASS